MYISFQEKKKKVCVYDREIVIIYVIAFTFSVDKDVR